MADAYDLRSNMKDKPGSQGTLFQVRDKGLLNPQQRWPRGYTPERSREVEQAMRTVPVTHPDHMEDSHEPGEYHEMGRYRPQLLDVVKRSTVPTEHLEGLREIHGEAGQGHDATYWPNKRTIGIDMTGKSTGEKPEDQAKALVHELGHHFHMNREPLQSMEDTNRLAMEHASRDKASWQAAPTSSGIAMAANKVRPGVDEAHADNYLTEHYRSRGKIANQAGAKHGAYEENFTHDRLDALYPGYTDVRPQRGFTPASHMGPQFEQTRLPGMDSSWERAERDKAWFKR